MTSNLDKALALIGQDVHVLPVRPVNEGVGKAKAPFIRNGFLGATTSQDIVLEWWTQWPQALVGYWTGASNVVVLDLDVKQNPTGEENLENWELDFASPVTYVTPSGGSHHVYRAPSHKNLRPTTNLHGLIGVDLRAGNSYAIWYGEVPELETTLRETPDWILKRQSRSHRTPSSNPRSSELRGRYTGNIDDWIDWLSDDEPWFAAKAIDATIDAKQHIGHDDLLRLVYRIHMTRLDGATGLGPVFQKLVEKFRATTNNHDGWQRELEDIVRGAIGANWNPTTPPTTISK